LRSPPVQAAVRAASRKRISSARTFAHEAHVRAFAAETTFGPRNDYRVKIADCAGLPGFFARPSRMARRETLSSNLGFRVKSATFTIRSSVRQRSALVAPFMFDAGPAWHRLQSAASVRASPLSHS